MVVSDPTPDIPADMIERAARAWWEHEREHMVPDSLAWDQAWGLQDPYRIAARKALSAALAGRVPVALPEPSVEDEDEDGKVWRAGFSTYSAYVDRWKPIVATPGGDLPADEAEEDALALLAAAREARRLAAESGDPT